MLFLLYALFGAWKCMWRGKMKTAVTVSSVIALTVYFLPDTTAWFGIEDCRKAAIFFSLGMAYNLFYREYGSKPSLWQRLIWIVFGTGMSIALVWCCRSSKVPMLAVGVLMISICRQISVLIGENHICGRISENKFTIYLFSWPFQAVTMVLTEKAGACWQITSCAMFAAGIIMPMALAYTYKRLKIPGKYIFDLITGIDSGKETA